jgi:hypothetical protein
MYNFFSEVFSGRTIDNEVESVSWCSIGRTLIDHSHVKR